MNENSEKTYSYFDFLPVILATLYAGRAGGDYEAWRTGFLLGVGLVILQFMIYRLKKREIDPFAVGMNVFLIVGAVGFQFHINWVLEVYGELREALGFIFISLIGILFIAFKKEGLLSHQSETRKYSFLLWLSILLAGLFSYQFKGDQLLSVTAPFTALFFLRARLNKISTPAVA